MKSFNTGDGEELIIITQKAKWSKLKHKTNLFTLAVVYTKNSSDSVIIKSNAL